ncbi:hypothetical protein NKR23_g9742 [Pleurostoma richardsiae]|uniref:Uncharacterized protein n=1 Tax=Pleurostoma richardsiae TaxID=41990 RepID=A0AA38RC05_9PEZI|nr:hypothetical protein NKR23_g9742 [Pleurostoma richardsiae]
MACKPGGWIESFEASPMIYSDDGTVKDDSAMAEWGKFFTEGGKKLGRVFTPLDDDLQEKGMEEAGFVDIQTLKQKIPIGGWAEDEKLKEMGSVSQVSLGSDLEGYVSFMANLLLGWNTEQVIVYCAQFRRELRSGKCHSYYNQRCVWGRKPEAS